MPIECQLHGAEATIVYRPVGATKEPYKPRAEVKRALSHKAKRITLDLTGVTTLANDEILEILACHIAAVKAQVKLVIRNCTAELADFMRRSGVGNLVAIEESPAQG